jgi:dienelactone hydrolase
VSEQQRFRTQARPHGGLTEVRFWIMVDGEEAPGLVVLPTEADEPVPLAFLQHPLTSSKDDYFVREVALRWAHRGWACAGLDAPFHGERANYDPMGVMRDRERFAAASARFSRELTAAIDELAARYPIDTARMGYVGYSFGSMLGIPAVAADGRFRAAAFCLVGEGGLIGTAADASSPVQALRNVAVRIVAKSDDEFFSKASTEALYAALPGERDLVWLPGGHFEIGPDVIDAAEAWMRAKLA